MIDQWNQSDETLAPEKKSTKTSASGTKNSKTKSNSKAKKTPTIVSVDQYTTSGISFRVWAHKSSFIDGYNVCVEKFSKRKTILLVNGLTRTKDHWLGFDEELAEEFNVIAIDPRGVGDTRAKIDWSHSIEQMVGDVKAVIDTVGLSKVNILGFSLGGMVAMDFAMRHPECTESIVVVNSSIGGGSGKLRLSPRSALALVVFGLRSSETLHSKLSHYLFSPFIGNKKRDSVVADWVSIEKKYGRGAIMMAKQLVAAAKFRDPKSLENISAPTLLVCGGKDRFVSPEHSRKMKEYIPSSKLVEIKKGGHELHMDSRKRLLSAVIGHVDSH